jgi:peptidoglycan hydrolase-like protein with peptidoglycan-binding domain
MTDLRRGSRGQEVGRWQAFLEQQGYLQGAVDGIFGEQTGRATQRFQIRRRLTGDGVVGPATLQAAAQLGFVAGTGDVARPPGPPRAPDPPTAPAPPRLEPASPTNDFYPPKPAFPPLRNDAERQRIFGKFAYVAAPSTANPQAIKITDGWDQANIVSVTVPGLAGLAYGWGGASKGKLSFHRRAAPQLVSLWQAWQAAGLLDRLLTFDGAFVPRFQRGNTAALSNHAFGSAFDINARWNGFGKPAAKIGEMGCVMALVSLANQWGFYWGGHFSGRVDGMHFEVAKLL